MSARRPLDDVAWRDEILQALFWLSGEGLGDAVAAPDLVRLLDAEAAEVDRHLRRLAARGDLEPVPGAPIRDRPRYRLSETGRREGARRFADEFSEMVHRGHYECADDCWCHDPDRAGEPCPSHAHGHDPASGHRSL